MSIIYDALKRTGVKIKETKNPINPPKRNNSKVPRFAYILCILIMIGLIGYFMGRSSPVAPPAPGILPSKELKTATGKRLPPLSLTGIFFSDGEYLALINEQAVRKGDFIEGAQIEEIDAKGVQIIFEDSSLRLSYP